MDRIRINCVATSSNVSFLRIRAEEPREKEAAPTEEEEEEEEEGTKGQKEGGGEEEEEKREQAAERFEKADLNAARRHGSRH